MAGYFGPGYFGPRYFGGRYFEIAVTVLPIGRPQPPPFATIAVVYLGVSVRLLDPADARVDRIYPAAGRFEINRAGVTVRLARVDASVNNVERASVSTRECRSVASVVMAAGAASTSMIVPSASVVVAQATAAKGGLSLVREAGKV